MGLGLLAVTKRMGKRMKSKLMVFGQRWSMVGLVKRKWDGDSGVSITCGIKKNIEQE